MVTPQEWLTEAVLIFTSNDVGAILGVVEGQLLGVWVGPVDGVDEGFDDGDKLTDGALLGAVEGQLLGVCWLYI